MIVLLYTWKHLFHLLFVNRMLHQQIVHPLLCLLHLYLKYTSRKLQYLQQFSNSSHNKYSVKYLTSPYLFHIILYFSMMMTGMMTGMMTFPKPTMVPIPEDMQQVEEVTATSEEVHSTSIWRGNWVTVKEPSVKI